MTIKRLGIYLLCLLVIVALSKNFIIKKSVEMIAKAQTGCVLDIQKFKLKLLTSTLLIKNLELHNPEGFEYPRMISIPEVYADISVMKLLEGKAHLNEARFNFEELVVVKNKEGKININELKMFKKGDGDKKEKVKKKDKKALYIQRLELKIGKVVYKDFSGIEPAETIFNIGIDGTYNNISNPKMLMALLLTQALAKTTLQGLMMIDAETMKALPKATLEKTQKAMQKTSEATKEAAKKTGEAAKELLNTSKETTQKATEEVGDTFKQLKESLPSFK